ncbi:MAG: hypothetical protein K0U98_20665 [Deltaproteobacteria bacterium]|nr:hypothetical protein [Deltaproteobacteria bacterium]
MAPGRGLERLLRGPLAAPGFSSVGSKAAGANNRTPGAPALAATQPLVATPARPVLPRDLGRPLSPGPQAGGTEEGSDLRPSEGIPPQAAVASLLAPARVLDPGPRKSTPSPGPSPSSLGPQERARSAALPHSASVKSSASRSSASPFSLAPEETRSTTPPRVRETIRERVVERHIFERQPGEERPNQGKQPAMPGPAPIAPSTPEVVGSPSLAKAPEELLPSSSPRPATEASEAARQAEEKLSRRLPGVDSSALPSPVPSSHREGPTGAMKGARESLPKVPVAAASRPSSPPSSRQESLEEGVEGADPNSRQGDARESGPPATTSPTPSPPPALASAPPRPVRDDGRVKSTGPSPTSPGVAPVSVRIGRIEVKPAKAGKGKPRPSRQPARRHQIDPGLGFSGGGR